MNLWWKAPLATGQTFSEATLDHLLLETMAHHDADNRDVPACDGPMKCPVKGQPVTKAMVNNNANIGKNH